MLKGKAGPPSLVITPTKASLTKFPSNSGAPFFTFTDDSDDKTRKDFFGEAQLLAKFGSHPNVMGLLKVIHKGSPAMVITHFMPHGDLKHYLKK